MIQSSILENFDRVVRPFQQNVPELAQWMNQDQCDDWGDSDARVAEGEKKVGCRTSQREKQCKNPHARGYMSTSVRQGFTKRGRARTRHNPAGDRNLLLTESVISSVAGTVART